MDNRRFNRRRSIQNKGSMKWVILFLIIVLWIISYIYARGDSSLFMITKI